MRNWVKIYLSLNSITLLCYCTCNAFFDNIFQTITSPFSEVCDSKWVPQDLIKLENYLESYVFGQHIATETVLIALQSHFRKQHRQKPLVLSFHGWPGGGKGYVGNFIIKSIFKNGEDSKFVKKYMAKKHFPLKSEVHTYQRQLQNDLEDTIRNCPKAVFLFDEVDKYPPNVLDGIKAYLDFSSNVNGNDFREAIFIFITNNGQKQITDITIDNYKNGYKREDLDLKHFDYVLKTTAFNDIGGFYQSDLIRHHLIDYVVPFLPLEARHVEMCIEAELKLNGLEVNNLETLNNVIMEGMLFGPEEYELFSTNGCKSIAEKVSYVVEKVRRRQRSEF